MLGVSGQDTVAGDATGVAMIPSKKTLAKLKEEIYVNAVHLFCDGCILFKNKSYSSANALAILSFEELGKLEMVDAICGDISGNPEHDPQRFLNHLFSRPMFFSHKNKQMWASDLFNGNHLRHLKEGILDQYKQDSLYVGYSNRRIWSPRHISSNKAYAQIAISFNKIKEIGDLGFNGFYCESEEQSEKRAKKYYLIAEKVFSSLKKPTKRKL
jgi:AbiV family abortive infection protein